MIEKHKNAVYNLQSNPVVIELLVVILSYV